MSILDRHFGKFAAGVLAIFAVLRVWAFGQFAQATLLKIPVLDSETYYRWGYALATGQGHPDGPFWLAPGYPQFMSWVFRLLGDFAPGTLVAVQMVLSLGTLFLLMLLTRRLFGAAAGVLAGLLGCLYAPWLYYDGMLLSASWILFLNTALLFVLLVPSGLSEGTARNKWAWGIAGGLCALSAMARPSVLLFAGLLLLFLLVKVWKKQTSVAPLLVFALALVLVHLPISLRNARVGGSPVFVTASGGVNFYIGNRAGATGVFDEPDFVASFDAPSEAEGFRVEASKRAGQILTLPEASAYWRDQALGNMRKHPFGWSTLAAKKLWWTMRKEEVANNFSFRATQLIVPLVSTLPLHWGLLLPLALAGVVIQWSSRRRFALFGLYALGYVLTSVFFFASSEYRFPLVAIGLPLAAAALLGIIEAFRQRETTRVTIALALYLAVLLPANMPSAEANAVTFPRVDFANVGHTAMRANMISEAMAAFSRALALDPENQEARLGLADALWTTRNFDLAREEYERAGVPAPDRLSGTPLDSLQLTLSEIAASKGDSAALAYLDKEIPDLESLPVRDLWVTRAQLQAKLPDYISAYRSMERAHDLDPENPELLHWMGVYALQLNYPRSADSLWKEAVKLYPAYAPSRIELGLLAFDYGQIEDAAIQSRELDKIQIANDSLRARAKMLDSLLTNLNW
ncbi:MAG: tetratricopeptide repeat protein [Calditrichaeota bacterium]|nr:tetratricopeptide repeat protein [Calditrichota bacterium]